MPIDQKAMAAAREKLAAAESKLQAMRRAKTIGALTDEWSGFLTEANRVFTRLVIACNNDEADKKWFRTKKRFRENDELLSYLENARHADEHGIEKITKPIPMELKIGAPGERVFINELRFGANGEVAKLDVPKGTMVEFRPGGVQLLPVKVRGKVYSLPTMHLGEPFKETHAISLAEHGYRYFSALVDEVAARI